MKKNLVILCLLFASLSASARGVLIQCWEMGLPQTEEYMIYQNDGGYIHEGFVLYDDMVYVVDELEESKSECISWDFPFYCQDKFVLPGIGSVEVHLKQKIEFADGSQGLVGKLKELFERDIFCKRQSL